MLITIGAERVYDTALHYYPLLWMGHKPTAGLYQHFVKFP